MLKKSEIEKMRDRWSEKEIKTINEQLEKGKIIADHRRIAHGDEIYVDWRGITITAPNLSLWKLKAKYVDFSYACGSRRKELGLIGVQLDHCLFIGCGFEGYASTDFSWCDFSNTNMNGVGFPIGTVFTDCNFDSSNLTNSGGPGRFVRCSFQGTNFKGAHLMGSVFDHCLFTDCKFGQGSLAKSQFIGTRPEEIKKTILTGTVFK